MAQMQNPSIGQMQPDMLSEINNQDILSPTMLQSQMGYNIPPQHAFANQYLNQGNHFNTPMNGLFGGNKKKKIKRKK